MNKIGAEAGIAANISELTTVTKKVRRVGRFDPEIVRRAIRANMPTRIVLNHLDYVDPQVRTGSLTTKAAAFVEQVEAGVGCIVDWLGIGPGRVIDRAGRILVRPAKRSEVSRPAAA